jgi:hypothetical protein
MAGLSGVHTSKMHTHVSLENVARRDYLRDLKVNGKILSTRNIL